MAAVAPIITGAAIGATTYTAAKVVENEIKNQPPLAGWNAHDFVNTALIGGCTEGVFSLVTNVMTSAATSTASAVDSATSKALIPWVDTAGPAPNYGALGNWSNETLAPGALIDRYGASTGHFVSPLDTPFEMRSLAGSAGEYDYNVYKVISVYDVKSSIVAPWNGQFGFGVQYFLPYSISTSIDLGYITPYP